MQFASAFKKNLAFFAILSVCLGQSAFCQRVSSAISAYRFLGDHTMGISKGSRRTKWRILAVFSFVLFFSVYNTLQAAVWKSADLLNNDWSNWSGLGGGPSLIEPPAPDSEVNVKIGFFQYTYLTTRFTSTYSFLEHPVIPGKRYEYTARARLQEDILSTDGIFSFSWFSRISGYTSSTGSSNWPIPNYSYVTNVLDAVINEDFIRLEIGCSLDVLGNTRLNYSYAEFDWARLKQVIYEPNLDIAEEKIYVIVDSNDIASVTIGLHLNDLSFADTPTSWSIDWGDGIIESNPALNSFHEHTYYITTGIGQTWTATLHGTNQAGSSSDTVNVFVVPKVPEPTTITVDDDGPADFDNIQAAIDAAWYGDTILVTDETYTEVWHGDTILVADGTYTGEGNRDIDFLGKAITLRSENGPNNCIIDCNGTEAEPHRGFYFHSGEDENSVLDGFTITNGCATSGGGICCEESSPTVTNCAFSGNLAYGESGGGGMYNNSGNPTIINCTFSGNSAASDYARGGGMSNYKASPTVKNCTFSRNSAEGYYNGCGGGMSNAAFGIGSLTITNCTFSGNSSSDDGGGMFNFKVRNNVMITNCTFSGNSSKRRGGAMYSAYSYGYKTTVANCILYGDIASDGKEIYLYDSTMDVNYSDVEGGWPGIGNLDAEPCFAQPGYWDANGTLGDVNDDFWVEGDYHLLPDSPCINAGDPNYVPEPNEIDLDGLPRVIGGRIDMGAYEFNHQPLADAGPNQVAYAAFIDGYIDVNLDGSGSYDDDNDPLDYYWSWTINSNNYEANGVSPAIQLPAGKHTIELVVDDGIDESQPDYCTIEVIAPLRASLSCIPYVLNPKTSYPKSVSALISMPQGVRKADVNLAEPLVFYPGQIKSQRQVAFEFGCHQYRRAYVRALFDKSECIEHLKPGINKVNVVGKLTSGRYYNAVGYLGLVPAKWYQPYSIYY